MTQERHDPWALLREAREDLALAHADLDALRQTRKMSTLTARIDAALAEHDAVPPGEVMWKSDGGAGLQSNVGDYRLSTFNLRNGGWLWSVENRIPVLTLDEAKSAAIAAARGMR